MITPSITDATPDRGKRSAAAAVQSISDNGFPLNHTNPIANLNAAPQDTVVVVNIPPKSGPFTGKLGYVEVIVTYTQPRYFSTIWGSTGTDIVARAVAKGYWGGTGAGVIVLDPTAKEALSSTGGASGIVTGGAAIIVDSNNIDAASDSGSGGFTSTTFQIT